MHVRMMTILALIVPLGIGAALARPETCLACSCAVEPTPAAGWTADELTQNYDVVFRGYVVDAGPFRDTGNGTTDGTYVVTMAASMVWAGPVRATYEVQAGHGGGDCTISFSPGQEWLVFANGSVSGREPLGTGICSRTMPASDGRVDLHVTILGDGTPVVDIPRLKAVGAVPILRESLMSIQLLAAQIQQRG
jgi:hypothetical protein